MIFSVLIVGDSGLAPTNHVLGLYRGMIIDGESDTVQVFNERNLNKACGYNVWSDGVMNGYLLISPKRTVIIKDFPREHRGVSSATYKVINENGNSMDLINSYEKMKKQKNRRRKPWDGGTMNKNENKLILILWR